MRWWEPWYAPLSQQGSQKERQSLRLLWPSLARGSRRNSHDLAAIGRPAAKIRCCPIPWAHGEGGQARARAVSPPALPGEGIEAGPLAACTAWPALVGSGKVSLPDPEVLGQSPEALKSREQGTIRLKQPGLDCSCFTPAAGSRFAWQGH